MSSVGVDNFLGGYLATEHLIQLKHRRIGMLAGEFNYSDRSFHRWHGYKKCLKDYQIAYDPELFVRTRYSPDCGCKGLKLLAKSKYPPTAVFCSNDLLAIGAIEGARQMGLDIPKDISIIGFDDMQIASLVSPSLTTIKQPTYEMGKQGAEALIDIIERKSSKPVHKLLDISLVARQSTGAFGS
jgi:LacI family transcriptional regulator